MAAIIKRKSKYSVAYYVEEDGVKRQKWETFGSLKEAKARKAQVEHEQNKGTFVVPTARTISDLLEDYVSLYGINIWAPSTYQGKRGLIDNYIKPLIGDVKLNDVSPRYMDRFYQSLLTIKCKPSPYKKENDACLTAHTVREIHKIMNTAFNQAVKWELMSRNPVQNATLPKEEKHVRDMWTAETLFKAIDLCEDDILRLALNVAFACSLRMGEMLGLTWDCIDISQDSIDNNRAYIFVNKELQRISREALSKVGESSIVKRFPAVLSSRNTYLVLKEPKTKTSVRKVFLPRAVAEMLVQRKNEVEEIKEMLGDEYRDYDLVFCSASGTPLEGAYINRLFSKLIQENELPKVVFHSIRHTSTTYKLKLSGGDIKAVQGDTGHAQATMVTERYSHIIDDDRRLNAERFQAEFYSSEEPKPLPVTQPEVIPEPSDPLAGLDTAGKQALLLKLLTSTPEMANILKTLAQAV